MQKELGSNGNGSGDARQEPMLSWTSEHKDLWARIALFEFDDGIVSFPFVARLARDNGWSSEYAGRVNREYRRFTFLAASAGHPVTPSDQVDQAWHLHLLYTRSYWNCFCREVLRAPLHHHPTNGGTEETTKFNAWYAETLASYRLFFGTEPPEDIWPNPATRFGDDIYCMRVNVRRAWVISKRRAFAIAFGSFGSLIVAGLLATW